MSPYNYIKVKETLKKYKRGDYMQAVCEQDTMLLDRRTKELITEYVPEGDVLEGIVCFFSVFADATRVRMLSALAISEMCVTDLSRVLNINQTTVSHQLRLLKNLGIVKSERHGKIIFYSLVNDTVNDVMLKGVEFLGC